MPLEISGKVSISDEVKSGDLLIRFAITSGGEAQCRLAAGIFGDFWAEGSRNLKIRFFTTKRQFQQNRQWISKQESLLFLWKKVL